jgi:uncharacterized protein (UPF0276 family)
MNARTNTLGVGIGWRPELALWIDRDWPIGFVEILAEDFFRAGDVPAPIRKLIARGTPVIPHGIGLSLGGAERPDPARLKNLAELARKVDAPLVSEHIAFVRAGGMESGHLLPVPRTRAALDVLVENVKVAQDALPAPLALENIATLVAWPEDELDEAAFIAELLERTGALLLLDIENVYANALNHRFDAAALLERLPLDRVAYAHVAGGVRRGGLYHDTHAHAVPPEVLELVRLACSRAAIPGVLLERDDRFPAPAESEAELRAIDEAMRAGAAAREVVHARQ